MELNWNIFDVLTEKIGEKLDVITTIRFTVVCKTNEKTGKAYGTTSIEFDETAPFIEYANLTELELLEWVKKTLDAETIAFYESIAQQRSTTIEPTSKKDLPWQVNTES